MNGGAFFLDSCEISFSPNWFFNFFLAALVYGHWTVNCIIGLTLGLVLICSRIENRY